MLLRVALFAVLLMTTADASTGYNGIWNFTARTTSGGCDPTYSYKIQVQGKSVAAFGAGGADVRGVVSDDGRVTASVSANGTSAQVSGSLQRSSGSGTWYLNSTDRRCAGSWVAVKRGNRASTQDDG